MPQDPPIPPGGTSDAEKANVDELAKQVESQQQINIDLSIRLEQLKEINRLERERAELLDSQLETARKDIKEKEIVASKIKDMLSLLSSGGKLTDEMIDKMKLNVAALEQAGGAAGELSAKLKEALAAGKFEEALQLSEEIAAAFRDADNFGRELDNTVNRFAQSLGITAKFADTGLGKVTEFMAQIAQGGVAAEEKLKLIRNAIGQFKSPLNIIGNLVQKVAELGVELDKTNRQFQAGAGISGDFTDEIIDIYDATQMAGVSMKDASLAMQSLVKNYSDFDPTARATNKYLAKQISLLDKWGVNADTSTSIMETMTKSFGHSAEEAADLTTSMVMMGEKIGISMQKMAANMKKHMDTLAFHGKRGEDVFRGLAAASKAAGMEMDTLMTVAGKFDTFDSAADTAANLNAVLGTQLSAMQMINLEEHDRIRLIGAELKAMNFAHMDKYTQKHIQMALGLGSVGEAIRLAEMEGSEFDKYMSDMKAQDEKQKAMEDLLKITEQLVEPFEQFKLALVNLATEMKPLIKAVAFLLTKLTSLINFMARNSEAILYTIGLVTLWTAAKKAWLFYGALKEAMLWKTVVATGAVTSAQAAQRISEKLGITTSMAKIAIDVLMTKGTWLLTAAKWALNSAAVRTAVVFGVIAAVLHMRKSPPVYALFGFMAVGVIALAIAFKLMGPKAIVAAFAIGLIAAGIGLIYHGIAAIIQGITEFTRLMIESAGVLPTVAGGLYLMGAGLMFVGSAGLLAMTGMVMGAIGLGAILASLALFGVPMSEIQEAGEEIFNIGTGILNFATGISSLVGVVGALKGISKDTFLAATMEGGKTSMVLASEGIIKNVDTSNINVKVDIPEISAPNVEVKVFVEIDGSALDSRIKRVVVNNK